MFHVLIVDFILFDIIIIEFFYLFELKVFMCFNVLSKIITVLIECILIMCYCLHIMMLIYKYDYDDCYVGSRLMGNFIHFIHFINISVIDFIDIYMIIMNKYSYYYYYYTLYHNYPNFLYIFLMTSFDYYYSYYSSQYINHYNILNS